MRPEQKVDRTVGRRQDSKRGGRRGTPPPEEYSGPHPLTVLRKRVFHKRNLGNRAIKSTHLAIVWAIAYRSNALDEPSYPNQKTIARDAHVAPKTLRRRLPEITGGSFPLFKTHKGRHGRTEYFVVDTDLPWTPHVAAERDEREHLETTRRLQTLRDERPPVAAFTPRPTADEAPVRQRGGTVQVAQFARQASALDPRKPGPRKCGLCGQMRELHPDGKWYDLGSNPPLHAHQDEGTFAPFGQVLNSEGTTNAPLKG